MDPGPSSFRAFLAVMLPESVRLRAATLIESGRAALDGVRWVETGNLHLTVKFLGQTPLTLRDGIGERLGPVLREVRPFEALFKGVGAFPSASRPRVIFIDLVEGRRQLAFLIQFTEKVMADLGFAPEERPPNPHLTVGRVKDPEKARRAGEWLLENRDRDFGSCPVSQVALVRSDLEPAGPRYTVLEAYPLGG